MEDDQADKQKLDEEIAPPDGLIDEEKPHQSVDSHCTSNTELERNKAQWNLWNFLERLQWNHHRCELVHEKPWETCEERSEEKAVEHKSKAQDVQVLRQEVAEVGHDAVQLGSASLRRAGTPVELSALKVQPHGRSICP